ncbi:single-stranded-DNA-specific exonuclease RecJ [Pseudidiomarina aestuarii]|uniref:Single-stranded-DNA-specific exonuclease RecJ n=1 Tax=Pseudidiomarina aestuarii TaxID=624146 RepID=A0A6N4DK37_9GAMM|nr:single-stranded-DNA-specific exonuclease RecJ [Pseudidiomarina aestuarii]
MQIKRYPDHAIDTLPTAMPALLRQIIARRGVTSIDELQLTTQRLPRVDQLRGAHDAAQRLAQAIKEQQHICICGDFDADGATSTALMVSVLRACGARHVSYIVPNRFADGYGLSPAVVSYAQQQGAELIVTVDSGISCHAGIAAAAASGIPVIVTDHHLPGPELPAAAIIVNPNHPDCSFPSKSIAGVGVAFYVLLALRQVLREQGLATPNLADWLDLVAVGTVADVVKLDGINRILVHQGLQRIRSGRCRPGIQALLTVAGREPAQLQAADLGFAIGPRINAAGRLDDMAVGIECLLADTQTDALLLAQQLDQYNRERRAIETEMREQAAEYVADYTASAIPSVVVLYQKGWHQGVIGIVAGRVKEQVHRPVIAFADAEDGLLKGSARSIAGIHMRDLLEAVHSHHPQLIERFGGHAMAAGLTLKKLNLERFQEALEKTAERWLDGADLEPVLWSDGELDESSLTQQFVQQLQALGPFGQGFPEPLFDGEFGIIQQRIVGTKHLKLVLATPAQVPIDAIAFNIDTTEWPDASVQRIHAAYRVQLNTFRGRTSVQLQLEHFVALR